MPRFYYKAVRPDGELVEGEIDAASQAALVERLRGQGQIPIRAEPRAARAAAAAASRPLFKRRRLGRKDIAMLTRELAMLLQSGLPLDRALSVIAEVAGEGPLGDLVARVLERVRGGATLADALQAAGDMFPNFYVGMVRAGEAGGSLVTVLERLADALERAQALRESVRSALIYPMIVVVLAVASLAVIMTLVIPEFRPLFEDAGQELPYITRIVIAISDFTRDFWWALAAAAVALGLGLRRQLRNPVGRLRYHRWLLRTRLLGGLVVKVEVARFSRTLGTLLANGVSVLDAVSMTAETLGNLAVAETVAAMRGRLAEGEGLARPLAETARFPPLALQLIQVGEESGQLVQMLLRLADIYDDEVKRTLERLLALLVPLVTITLGVLIAVIIGSMLAAIMSVYDLPF